MPLKSHRDGISDRYNDQQIQIESHGDGIFVSINIVLWFAGEGGFGRTIMLFGGWERDVNAKI
jgi:hypothetical protein